MHQLSSQQTKKPIEMTENSTASSFINNNNNNI